MMRRICHVLRGSDELRTWGGAETALRDLVTGTGRRGYEMQVVAPRHVIDAGGLRSHARCEESEVRGHDVGRLTGVFHRLRPDVVVAHTLRAAVVSAYAARIAGVPVCVSNLHNSLHQEAEHVTGLDHPRGRAKFLARNVAFRSTLWRPGEATVAISPSVRDDLVEHSGVPPERVTTILNWLSPPFFHGASVEDRRPQCERDVVFLGRFEQQKDPLLFLRMVQELPEGWRAAMYGAGPLLRQARELALKENLPVVFREHTSRAREVMERSRAVVVTSRFEGFGRVAVEALASGVPVVLADVAGLRDAMTDIPTDLIRFVDSRDPRSWAAACVENAEAAPERLARARTSDAIRRTRTVDAALDAYIALYEDRYVAASGKRASGGRGA